MKSLGKLLDKKDLAAQKPLDEKSLLQLVAKIIREEYGRQGSLGLKVEGARNHAILVRCASSNWANEIQANKEFFLERINAELGRREIREMAVLG